MLSFILIAVLITLLTLVLLVRPLLKTRNSFSYERQAQNIHFAKERLKELEQQLSNASISKPDYEALKLEIESTLALDIDLSDEVQKPSEPAMDSRNGLIIGLLCVVVPLASLALYKITGTPAGLSVQPAQQNTVAAQAGNTPQVADIESMLSALEAKLQKNPSDIQGWTMLARSYYALGRYRDAIEANTKLLKLGGDNPDVYAALADSSALLANGVLAGQPSIYVEKALALQDNHPQGLWLAGLSAAQTSNGDLARQHWNKLLPLLAGAPAQQQELQAIIDQSFDFSDPAAGTAKANTAEDSESATLTNAAAPSLSVRVSIDDALVNQVSDSDVVFVFARAKQGPPAPLAVKRLRVSDLPANITLSDSDAMMDQFKLSRFDTVLVSARVAIAGNPIAQPGDFQSVLFETQTSNAKLINLTISELVE